MSTTHPRPSTTPVPAGPLQGAAWLLPAALVVALVALAKAPAIDEEGYLWIAANLDWLRPYDWTRIWAPYAADSYAWAHPPLHLYWLSVCSKLTTVPGLLRLAGLPWVALLAWSVTKLATRLCHHPGLAAMTWLASPIVVLGLQDTWMIDLPATALATFAMAAYREGLVDEDERWFVGSGIALGLAIETKYSMGVFVPLLLVHMTRLGPRPRLLLAMAAVIGAVELPLWALYGTPHPWNVWVHRGEIAAGGFAGRLEGTLARAALLAFPLTLLRSDPRLPALGLGAAIFIVLAARPEEMPIRQSALLLLLAAAGGAILARGIAAVVAPASRRRKGDRGDPLLLGGWLVAVTAGVVLAHNYAASRYLLPAAAPVALMLARSGEEVPWGKALVRVSAGISAAFALVLAFADYRFVNAGPEVAQLAMKAVEGLPASNETKGAEVSVPRFAGEWAFRGALEAAGWARYRPDEALAPGSLVVVAKNASPGPVAVDEMEPVRVVESTDTFPVRVVDVDRGVGLYAETLGPLPFGIGKGPIESAVVYRKR